MLFKSKAALLLCVLTLSLSSLKTFGRKMKPQMRPSWSDVAQIATETLFEGLQDKIEESAKALALGDYFKPPTETSANALSYSEWAQ